mgnify:CR=1 FL=1
MCDFTHTGSLQVQRRSTVNAIEENYDPKDIEYALFYAEFFALLSGIACTEIANDLENAQVLNNQIESLLTSYNL